MNLLFIILQKETRKISEILLTKKLEDGNLKIGRFYLEHSSSLNGQLELPDLYL